MERKRILSGMRPTGKLHLGNLHGALLNWKELQKDYQCFFFIADWHALTTEYKEPKAIHENILDMVIDWISVGLDPEDQHFFSAIGRQRTCRTPFNPVHDYTFKLAGTKSDL